MPNMAKYSETILSTYIFTFTLPGTTRATEKREKETETETERQEERERIECKGILRLDSNTVSRKTSLLKIHITLLPFYFYH